jgi:hypothetical protein
MRVASVIHDPRSQDEQILICAMDPGTDRPGFDYGHSRELEAVRAELPSFGVEEILFAELDKFGYVLVVRPTRRIAKSESYAEGCWTYTPTGEVELGRLLRGLTDLAWRAWEQGIAARAEGRTTEENEDEGLRPSVEGSDD